MFVTVHGARLYFDVDGEALTPDGPTLREKPTVILVHGGPGADHSVYKPFFSQLTEMAQVVYYDQRGNGRSDLCHKSTWNLAQWADDLKELCDTLGISKPLVLGTSFGGFVAVAYATRYPDHPSGLCLISTAAKVDFLQVYEAFERRGGRKIREIAEEYWDNPTDNGRQNYRTHCVPLYTTTTNASTDWLQRIIWRNETALWFNGPNNEHGRMDYRKDLRRITCPTLVMVGEQDPITPPEFSDVLVSGLIHSKVQYKRFDDCGHGVVGDRPEAALMTLKNFIQEVAATSNHG